MDLKNKTVLVTGGTSGIGAAIARAFASAGASVALSGRDLARGEAVAAETGGVFLAADVSKQDSCGALIEDVVRRFGRLDVLVNNAGIFHRGDAVETSDDHWRQTMTVNVDAPFWLSRAAIPVMRRQGGGAIVNIASDWALVGGRRAVAYCTSKGALLQMTRAMALDHAKEGIRINAVCPGDTDTPMLEAELAANDPARQAALAEHGAGIPMGRIGLPEEVAKAVLFLASAHASFTTGAALLVDGGHTAM